VEYDHDEYDRHRANEFEFKGVPMSLEESLGKLESLTAKCVEAILGRGRLSVRKPEVIEEGGVIIRFLAVQMVRTVGR
jgi:hypothetical protein